MIHTHYTDTQQSEMGRLIPDLIRSRRLIRDLVSRELRASYRNALIGFFWAILQPVMMMLILTFVFGYLMKIMGGRALQSQHSYAAFLLCGLVPWQFLTMALSGAVGSLVSNQELIKKVYFPREVIPLAAILNSMVKAIISFVILLLLLLPLEGFHVLGFALLWIPLVFAIQVMLVVGLGLLFSALNVFYQDVGYMIEVALTFGFYATPVFYEPPHSLGPWLYRLYMLNPMAHLLTAYRQVLLDGQFPGVLHLAWPMVMATFFCGLGTFFFRRNSPTFADHF